MGSFRLNRVNGPLLQPSPENQWESGAVFNPGTVRIGDQVNMLYRAVYGDNYSSIGYARLSPDGRIIYKSDAPVIVSESEIEKRGCEDPRIVLFEGTYYIFYTGFDGTDAARSINTRVMMAETADFVKFRKIGMVGPDDNDKDAMIFSEKIGNKVYFIHRIVPNIQIAVFDDLQEFIHPHKNYWPDHLSNIGKHTLMGREQSWEVMKIGAGPPPIRTDAGWLLIYHGVDERKVYRSGAALLKENDPTQVIARL
ncbi:MAG: glycosidase, partial [Calditrichaeota bacterium]